jgi:signal transduction histidine kinase
MGFPHWPDATPLVSLTIIIQLIFVIYGLYILHISIKATEGSKKNQLKYLLAIFPLAWIGGFTNWFLWYDIQIPPIGNPLVTLYLAAIAYLILRHNLLDINIVFRKGVIYSLLVTIITVAYFTFAFLTEILFRGFVGYRSNLLTLLIILTFILIFQPLKNRVQYIVDKYFFKGSIDQIDRENIMLREELQRSEKLKAVGTLAAGMAHEIKNPLTSIKTFTEYLSQKHTDRSFIDKFQKIVGSEVDKINGIVVQLLEFAKPKPLELKDVDMNGLIDDTLELLSNKLIKHRIDIEKSYCEPVPAIKGDIVQLKQVIINLVLNAVDSMKKTGGRIVLSTDEVSSPGKLLIKIEDTGCGIPKDGLAHIFDPFYSTKDTNTGLGLSVVHGIIKRHGGNITCESKIESGTRFTISLPA